MKHMVQWILMGVVLPMAGLGGAAAEPPAAVVPDASLRAFLPKFEQGTSRFMNGDAKAWKDNASKRDDVTIVGGWGAYERGWKEAGPRYDWAAARFKESGAKVSVEYVSSMSSGDLAYTVAIERATVRVGDADKPAPMALRVTHIYRKEDGAWKLVHRHADPLLAKTPPAAVLNR